MGAGQDLARQLQLENPGLDRSTADYIATQVVRGGKSVSEFQDMLGGAASPVQPFQDFAHQLAGIEINARQAELAQRQREFAAFNQLLPLQTQLLQQQFEQAQALAPLEQAFREQELQAAQARFGAEEAFRQFTDPITRGELLPGAFGVLGQPATQEEIGQRFDMLRPGIDERLTGLGLSASGAVPKLLGRLAQEITASDIGRSRGELAGLVNLRAGFPIQGVSGAATDMPSVGLTAGGLNAAPAGAISTGGNLGLGMLGLQQQGLSLSEQLRAQQGADSGLGFGDLFGGLAGIFGGNLFGGLGSGLARNLFSSGGVSGAMNTATGGTSRFR